MYLVMSLCGLIGIYLIHSNVPEYLHTYVLAI